MNGGIFSHLYSKTTLQSFLQPRQSFKGVMHRHQNHQFTNGIAQRRQEPPQYIRTSLRHYVQEKWLVTLLGVIGFFAGIFLIVGNEARAVRISKSLQESISLVTPVSPDAKVDKSNIGKLIYVTGVMSIHEPLTEVDYGISVLAVRLARNVQMFQWVETESDVLDGEGNIITTNYHYHTDWESRLIDSSSFANSIGHWNPKFFPIKKQIQMNENVKIGNYYLGYDLKKKFTDFVEITSDERPERQDIKLHSGVYYHCEDIWNPEVGDIRIQFSYAGHHGQVLTIVALLDSTLTLGPYITKQGVKILIQRLGHYTLESMFELEHAENKFFTWVYRGAGWLLLYISCVCLGPVLQIIVAHSPVLQQLLPVDHSSLKMTVSMCMTLLATAISWIWYRPILGIGIIIVTISILFFKKHFEENRSRQYNRL